MHEHTKTDQVRLCEQRQSFDRRRDMTVLKLEHRCDTGPVTGWRLSFICRLDNLDKLIQGIEEMYLVLQSATTSGITLYFSQKKTVDIKILHQTPHFVVIFGSDGKCRHQGCSWRALHWYPWESKLGPWRTTSYFTIEWPNKGREMRLVVPVPTVSPHSWRTLLSNCFNLKLANFHGASSLLRRIREECVFHEIIFHDWIPSICTRNDSERAGPHPCTAARSYNWQYLFWTCNLWIIYTDAAACLILETHRACPFLCHGFFWNIRPKHDWPPQSRFCSEQKTFGTVIKCFWNKNRSEFIKKNYVSKQSQIILVFWNDS